MKVLIVGGGIAGLAAAIGLRRAGHRVKVFERSSCHREFGAAIHVCPNASRVLLHWGLKPELAHMVTATRSIVAPGSSLRPLMDVDCSNFAEIYGAPWFLSHRADLHAELLRLATAVEGPGFPAEIALSSEVISYDAEAGSVTLADGSIHRADLVIAADGVHTSATRQVVGHITPALPTGAAAFRFLIPTSDLRQDPDTASLVGDGVMRVLITDGLRRLAWYPCANNAMQNFAGIHADRQADSNDEEDWNRSADVDEVLSEYHDFHPSILAVLKKAKNVKRWPFLFREPLPTWTRGRLLLIGDAAHPILPHQGQGGSQAIEDGGALGVIFTGLPANPTEDEICNRLALFEKVRLIRVSAIQIFSSVGQDEAWKIQERAQHYMPDGAKVPTSPPEFWEHNFSYDVMEDSRRQLQSYLEAKRGLCEDGSH